MDKNYRVEDTDDTIYIGNDLANEYIGSIYTYKLKEAATKANTAQGLPEMIKIATSRHFRENNSEKHYRNAALGWYRYDSRFVLPVYNQDGKLSSIMSFMPPYSYTMTKMENVSV